MNPYTAWYGRGRHQDWCTPRDLFDPLHARYGFDLDGAADEGNGLLPERSTIERPIPWTGRRVFCNPPWSDIASFVELAPHAELAVLLVPARVNARWYHRALELGARVEFFLGRPRFERRGERGMSNSPVDCLLLVFGKEHRVPDLDDLRGDPDRVHEAAIELEGLRLHHLHDGEDCWRRTCHPDRAEDGAA